MSVLFLIILFTSCKQSDTFHGKWFNKEFGLVVINDSTFTHFSNNAIPEATWPLIEKNTYECNEMRYEGCKLRKKVKGPILVTVEKDDDLILLKSQHPCFATKFLKKQRKLENLSELSRDITYDSISVRARIKGKWKEVIITKDNVGDIVNKGSHLTLDEQIWLIFFSGTDYYHDEYSPTETLILRFKSGRYQNTKSINIFPYPPHLRPFLNHVTSELNE